MTLSSNYSPIKQSGVGVTNFSYDFDLAIEESLVVDKTNALGVTTTLILNSGYTVDYDTKIVTLSTALATDEYIVIYRSTNLAQAVPFKTSAGFQAQVVESCFDKAMAINQENAYNNTRAIRAPIGTSMETDLPVPDAGKGLIWNETEDALINSEWDVSNLNNALTVANSAADAAAASATLSATTATASADSANAAAASALSLSSSIYKLSALPLPINGLECSTSSSGTILNISSGSCMDSLGTTKINLSSNITKTIVTWASGSGNGCIYTSPVADTKYNIFVIYNPTTLATDIYLDISSTAANIPSGYTIFRWLGICKTKVSSSASLSDFSQLCINNYVIQNNFDATLMTISAASATIDLSKYLPYEKGNYLVKITLYFNGTTDAIGVVGNWYFEEGFLGRVKFSGYIPLISIVGNTHCELYCTNELLVSKNNYTFNLTSYSTGTIAARYMIIKSITYMR